MITATHFINYVFESMAKPLIKKKKANFYNIVYNLCLQWSVMLISITHVLFLHFKLLVRPLIYATILTTWF